MKNEKTLKARQISAIKLLAVGTPAVRVAETLDVSVMTLWRWRQNSAFEAKLHAITTSGLDEIAQRMNEAALTAIENLQHLLCDLSLPATTQIKVSLGVLNAMASINGALEKGLRHRVADFDPDRRWESHGVTYDNGGERCQATGESHTV